ncbi:MAG: signal peptidase I [Candidatus Glassbacteria bacterium]
MREWVKSIGLALGLFLVIRTFLVQAFKIPTGSMEDTLLIGDFLLVNKLVYGSSTPRSLPLVDGNLPQLHLPGYDEPERGNIVVFEYPLDRSVDYVKRCVALPGDTVEMHDKVLYINHRPQEEPFVLHGDSKIYNSEPGGRIHPDFVWQRQYITDQARQKFGGNYVSTRDNFGPLLVPPGKYFCLGDNRDFSSDSRYWGFVDRELIKGRPLILYFSWDRNHWLVRLNRIGKLIG